MSVFSGWWVIIDVLASREVGELKELLYMMVKPASVSHGPPWILDLLVCWSLSSERRLYCIYLVFATGRPGDIQWFHSFHKSHYLLPLFIRFWLVSLQEWEPGWDTCNVCWLNVAHHSHHYCTSFIHNLIRHTTSKGRFYKNATLICKYSYERN